PLELVCTCLELVAELPLNPPERLSAVIADLERRLVHVAPDRALRLLAPLGDQALALFLVRTPAEREPEHHADRVHHREPGQRAEHPEHHHAAVATAQRGQTLGGARRATELQVGADTE